MVFCHSRFIINIPDEEFESIERICFQIELAHWFYEDFHRAKDPSLPKLTLEEFAQVSSCCPSPQKQLSFLESLFQLTNLFGGLLVFDHVPLLQPLKDDVEEIISQFKEYKTKVPVYGAIILNSTLDRVLLVKGYTSRSSWGFPKGKINKDEREIDCAAREVYEEIGYDLTPHLREPDHIEVVIREQKIKLYIVAGIPEDTIFEPKTRKEISVSITIRIFAGTWSDFQLPFDTNNHFSLSENRVVPR
jgi:mRNA-decapping enzyme subunit 2